MTDPKKNTDYQPWEIDLKGQPIAGRKRELTPYEIWVQSKIEKDGVEYQCPDCGEKNIILPNVTGQKCKNCGFKLFEYEDIEDELGISKKNFAPDTSTRMDTLPGETVRVIGKDLAIPDSLREDPIPQFSYSFGNFSFVTSIIFTIIYFVLIFRLVPIIGSPDLLGYVSLPVSLILKFLLLVFTVFTGISLFIALSNSSKITGISVDNDGVTFSGIASSTRMDWDEITSISTERELNNAVRTRGFYYSNLPTIFMIFVAIIAAISFPNFWVHGLIGQFDVQKKLFYVASALFFFLIFRASQETLDSTMVDSSSSSMYYNNHVTISTGSKSVSYSFIGMYNSQFVKALAIIILMSKKNNIRCRIDKASYQVAEKGQEHYRSWRR